MKILFVASEMEPLAKVGGLADVVGTLPLELQGLGCDVRVVVPFYRDVRENLHRLQIKSKVLRGEIATAIDWLVHRGRIRKINLGGVLVYLLVNESLYDRKYIYGSPHGDYEDNDIRFGFLSLGALEVAKSQGFKPDIIHCHDWQTALIPISLRWRKHLREDPFFKSSKVVFTIHNLAFQGLYGRELLDRFGLPEEIFTPSGIEFYGRVNLLKGAIVYSDSVTTVSETYAEEIKTPEYGCGLEGVLREVAATSGRLLGILNGIDYERWNPSTDRRIYANFSAEDLAARAPNKLMLSKELGLGGGASKPLIGMVTRLTEQKGVDLVVESLPEIFSIGYQLVILGTGEKRLERMLKEAEHCFSGDIRVVLGFDETLARRIYAGSDMYLMPSRFEPCGIGEMIALRYGSIPVVRATGGLKDTVRDHTRNPESSNGFVFRDFSKESLIDALARAALTYGDKDEWCGLMRRAMRDDYSWRRSSRKYLDLYNSLLKRV
ncbi:MAG: glycogen synthase GlgA [Candidatus Methanosuratincola sp.]|jgi:starch synthase